MLKLLLFGILLVGCNNTAQFHPVMGEDIISTERSETITVPDRLGAWYSDRYIDEVFGDCFR